MIRDCRIADHIKAEKDMTSPEVMSFFVYVKTIQQPPHRAGDILSPGWKRNRKKVSFIPFTVWKTGDNGIIGNKDGKNVMGGQ